MVQRSVALCDGKYIGIETIYTVIGGQQINIPEKVKELRAKSRKNELFCPCGCGANLILVAGDKNLREQHFRVKNSEFNKVCHLVTEGAVSVDSKIVLKCWIDDSIQTDDLESRVPISAVEDNSRKYEFTFLSRSKGIAVNYCHDRVNLSDEKMKILEENSSGISIIHVVDIENGGCEGQYPEGLMKVQDKQGYCLLLTIHERDYSRARLKAVFYAKNVYGYWQEVSIADGSLDSFRISDQGKVSYNNESLDVLFYEAKIAFEAKQNSERQRIAEQRKQHAEYLAELARIKIIEEEKKQKQLEEYKAELAEKNKIEEEKAAKLREDAIRRQQETIKQKLIKSEQDQEDERLRDERIQKRILEQEEASKEKRRIRNEIRKVIDKDIPAIDERGIYWLKCVNCGRITTKDEFSSAGEQGHINWGVCKACYSTRSNRTMYSPNSKNVFNSMRCPRCGAQLMERTGRNGRFLGCSNYPRCQYGRAINRS